MAWIAGIAVLVAIAAIVWGWIASRKEPVAPSGPTPAEIALQNSFNKEQQAAINKIDSASKEELGALLDSDNTPPRS